jgi:hypothetical protein
MSASGVPRSGRLHEALSGGGKVVLPSHRGSHTGGTALRPVPDLVMGAGAGAGDLACRLEEAQ